MKITLSRNDIKDSEIWILGDFNVDWLKRNNSDTMNLMSFAKNNGLIQCMEVVTRPNKKGGSCIDLIFTNSKFVNCSGILDDIVSDHYTVYCNRKKLRETKEMCWKTVRDYSKFNEENFITLVRNVDWTVYDRSLDPDAQWLFFKSEILNILSVMCPYSPCIHCIHHERLYAKLVKIGCSQRFVDWLKSYLFRTQIVAIGDKNLLNYL